MTSRRRRPGRPSHGSREKLVAATCELFAERGFTATSPTMVLVRSGVGHGSLYHYFDGKEELALAAIEQLRADTLAKLRLEKCDALNTQAEAGADAEDNEQPDIDAALDDYLARTEGRALLHLLADPGASESPALLRKVQTWCDELRVAIHVLATGQNADALAGTVMQSDLHEVDDPYLHAALGRGLLALPHTADLSHPVGPQ